MPAEYPTLPTAAGTTVSISVTAPASHDVAGFDAIPDLSWKEIGLVVNTGGFPVQVRDFSDVNLLNGSVLIIPGNEKMDQINIEAVFQRLDEGQLLAEQASDGKTVIWLRWVLPDGFTVYAAGYITGYGPTASQSTDYVACKFTFVPIFDVNRVGVVRSVANLLP